MKLCRDCKYFDAINAYQGPIILIATCKKVKSPPDVVYGTTLQVACFEARSEKGECGPDAKFFEPSEAFKRFEAV